jgi:NadR type nicotinamide-nucleotide adenylyltransferase
LVLGKFMPPHAGHMHLIDFARHYVSRLAVVMDSLPQQPIAGELRERWLRELFPQSEVFHLTGMPQAPEEHPEFWAIWQRALRAAVPFHPDFVFASEPYGQPLADVLDARFVPVDIGRCAVPISATRIREDPLGHWEFLPRCVRPHYVIRICVFGPESTGKSTLTRQLADHFLTVAVPEYARTHLERQSGRIEPEDIEWIARGQAACEDALALQANRLMFCDTDLLTTTIWSDRLFGKCPDWIPAEAERRRYDLYLLTDVDVPWVADPVRYLPDDRRSFFDKCLSELESRGRPYVRIYGDSQQRLRLAIEAVESLLVQSKRLK